MDYILGYTCANDVSARDWQFDKQKGQWARGKSFDTFCPLGPWIVTKDEIDDPNDLGIRCLLNGQIVQESTNIGDDFQHSDHHQQPEPVDDAAAGHGDPDRHAGRRRIYAPAAVVSQRRRCGQRRN